MLNYGVVLFRASIYRPGRTYQGKDLPADGSAICHCWSGLGLYLLLFWFLSRFDYSRELFRDILFITFDLPMA